MNYIKKLQAENSAQAREIQALRDGITDLRAHLASPKFFQDPTIQVQDVENRLMSLIMMANDVGYDS